MLTKTIALLLKEAATLPRSPSVADEPEFQELLRLLESNGERPVVEALSALQKAWGKAAAKRIAKPVPALPTAAAKPADYIARLKKAANQQAFMQILEEVRSTKALKTADVMEIANAIRGTTKKYKTRTAAIEDLKKSWNEHQRDKTKLRNIDGIF